MRETTGGRSRPHPSAAWLLGAGLLTFGGAGCDVGETPSDALLGAGQVQRALVTAFSPAPAAISGDEGADVSFDIGLLCVDAVLADNTVRIDVDWGDGSAPDTRTLTVITPVSTANCGGAITVCDSDEPLASAVGCTDLTHVYADGEAAGTVYTIEVTADHDGVGNQTASVTATIANVAPDITAFTRTGAAVEGSTQTFSAEGGDVGLLPDEIASVVWTFTPEAQVEDATTVTCTCANAPQCDDGSDEPLCSGADSTRARAYLDNGSYTATLAMQDKDGASDTATVGPTNINNAAPSDLKIFATGEGLTGEVEIEDDAGAATPVVEGSSYALRGVFTDPGIDLFRSADASDPGILWDLTGDDVSDHDGIGAITKASWPALDAASLVVGNTTSYGGGVLTPRYAWDDDDDAIPADHDVSLDFTVRDDDGASGTIARFIRVTDVDPVLTNLSATVAGSPVTQVNEGVTVVFTLTASSGADDPTFDPLSAREWRVANDGDSAHPSDAAFASRLLVAAGCGAADDTCQITFLDGDPGADNAYLVDVLVRDEDSSRDTTDDALTRTVTVENVLPDISVNLPSPATLSEAGSSTLTLNFSDPAGALDGAFTVGIDWGDGNATVEPTRAAPGQFTATHTFAENTLCGGAHPSVANTCTIDVTLCESGGTLCDGIGTSTTVVVQNAAPAPSFNAPAANATLEEGVPFALEGTFSDPAGALDDSYASTFAGFDNAPLSSTDGYADRPIEASGAVFTDVGAAGRSATLTFEVEDADAQSLTVTRTVSVVDNTPVITITDQRFVDDDDDEGSAVPEIDVSFAAETDEDVLSRIVVDWGDGSGGHVFTSGVEGVGAAGSTLTLTKLAPYDDGDRSYTVTVTVEDEDSAASANTTFDVQNLVPVVDDIQPAPPGPVVVSEGTAASFVARYTDASSADRNAPLLFHFDWGDGEADNGVPGSVAGSLVTGRASHLYGSPGTYTVTITVSDKDGGVSAPETITVEVVNVAPVVTDVFNTGPVTEGGTATVVGLVDNRGADELRYSFTFAGACAPGDGLTDADFAEPRPGTGTSSVAVSSAFADDGDVEVCFRVCDDDALPNSCAFGSTTVVVHNGAPVITSLPPPAPVDESAGASVTLTATATDPGSADTLSYAFDCTDDGTTDGQNTSGSFACSYTGSGVWQARVTVTDGDGGSDDGTVLVRVNNVAPSIASVTIPNVDEGQASTITVSASDPGGDALTYLFDYDSDGVYDASTVSGSASYAFPSDGAKTVGVRVCDGDGACVNESGATTVLNVAPAISSLSAPSSVTVGSAVTVSAAADDVGNDTLRYLFTFKDGAGAVVTTVGRQSSSVATATFASSGSYTVEVSVTDEANAPNSPASATATAGFTVTDINVAVSVAASPSVLNEGGSTTLTVTPNGTGPYLVSYDVNGDGDFDDAMDVTPADTTDTCTDDCATTVTYAQNNAGDLPFRVLVSVVDTGAGDSVATAIVSVTVRNVAPTLAEVADQAVTEGEEVSVTLLGDDAGSEDTLAYSLVSAPAGVALDADTGALSWTPGYADAGEHEIAVRVTDSDGAVADRSFTVTVAVIDTNGNGVSDTRERELNGGELLAEGAATTDSDGDGAFDLEEILAGTDPGTSDAPTAPVVISPDDERVSTLTPTLVVANATSPRGAELSYTFVVTEAEGGAEIGRVTGVAGGASTTQAIFDVAALEEDTAYEWYAFASDGVADGPASEPATFLVNAENAAPAAPDALTPLDGATFAFGSSPVLEARAVSDPDGDDVWYVFEVATADTFAEGELVVVSALRAVPFYSLPEALADGSYHWRAFASDGEADSAYGASASFVVEPEVVIEVNAAPSAPAIVGPADETLTTTTATLEIEAATDPDGDALSYQLELADNPAFAGATVSGSQAGLTFEVSDLEEDAVYYWRARAHDGELASDWVSAVFAVNAANGAPYGLALLSPAVGVVLDGAPDGFTVQNAIDPDGDSLGYHFVLSANEDLSEPLAEEEVAEGAGVTTWTPAELTLEAGATYYWSVEVSDGELKQALSGRFSLAGGESPGVPDEGGCGCSATESNTTALPWTALLLLGGLAGAFGRRRQRR